MQTTENDLQELRLLWLNMYDKYDLADHILSVARDMWNDEVAELKAELSELKENNGLNRAEVEVGRLLKVVAEKDAEIERLREYEWQFSEETHRCQKCKFMYSPRFGEPEGCPRCRPRAGEQE